MRRITACTAALISVLVVFASISASACDLSCWLRQSQTDCHSDVPMSAKEIGTLMSSAMNMGMRMNSGQMQQMIAPEGGAASLPASSVSVPLRIDMTHRLIPMSPQPEMAGERFIELSKPGMSAMALPDEPRSRSSCTHETCSQISASASPPSAGHLQLDFLHHLPLSISIARNLPTGFHWIKTGSPPPELHAEDFATFLRI